MANLPSPFLDPQFDGLTGLARYGNFNGMTGQPLFAQFHGLTGMPLAGYNGMTGEPLFGQFHSQTGQNLIPNAQFNGMTGQNTIPGARYNGMTGEPLNVNNVGNGLLPGQQFDGATGRNLIPGARYNGMTGEPLNPQRGVPLNRPALPRGAPPNEGINSLSELNRLRAKAGVGPVNVPSSGSPIPMRSGLPAQAPPPAGPPLPTRPAPTPGQTPPAGGGVVPGSGRPSTPSPGSGRPSTPPPGSGRPSTPPPTSSSAAAGGNNYSAFKGRFGMFRDPLQATGRYGSKLPGWATAPRSFGSAWATSPAGGFMTKPLTGKANVGAGMLTGMALSAMPGALTNAMGVDPASYGARSAQGIGNASALGLMGGVPVAATAGLGVAGADALAAPGGPVRDAINTVRANIPDFLGGPMGPTNDTSLEALANGASKIPYVGGAISGFLGGPSGAGAEDTTATPTGPAPLPPTPESIAQIASTAGLQDTSISDLQNMYSSNLALMRAQYQANPQGFAAAVTQAYNANLPEGADELKPEQVTDEYLQQSAFQATVDFLPQAVEQQSARNAMLSNALMYQTAISGVMGPEYDRWNALSAQASALGNQELANLYAARPGFMADQLRMQPMMDSLAGAQSFNDQVAQQIQAVEISNAAAAQRPDLFPSSSTGSDLNALLGQELLAQ